MNMGELKIGTCSWNYDSWVGIEERRLMHVYSEKQYMPHVYDVYAQHAYLAEGGSVVRLLGGDRKAELPST